MSRILKQNKHTPAVSTFDVFKPMGYEYHRTLKGVISDHLGEFESFGELQLHLRRPPKNSLGGRPVEAYLLNEEQFLLLVVLAKTSPATVDFKMKICKEFAEQKRLLAQTTTTTTEE